MSRKKIKKTERERELLHELNKRKRMYFISCVLLMLVFFGGENKIISSIEENNSYLKQNHAEENIIVSPGYEVEGKNYRVVGNDPYLIIKTTIDNIDTIDIKFKKKIKQDTHVSVYCLEKGEKPSEEDKIEAQISKGSDAAWITVPSGDYRAIRLDLDGSFVLDDISFSGYQAYRVPVNIRMTILLVDLLVILFLVFCYWKENRIFAYCCMSIEKVYPLVHLLKLNIARVIFLVVGVVLFLHMIDREKDWLNEVKIDVTTTNEQVYTSEDIVQMQDYDRKKDVFVQDGDDPQFVFKGKISKVNRIRVSLRKAEYYDMYIKAFYRKKGEDFSEKNSVDGRIWAYTQGIELKINEGDYESIRIDLDGNFELDQVSFYKYVNNQVPFWCYFTVVIIDVLFVLLWGVGFVYINKNRGYEFLLILFKRIGSWYIYVNRKIYALGSKYSIRLEKVFLVLGLVLGVAYAFLIPPGQIPDESTHASYMRSSLGYGEKMDEEVNNYYKKILSGDVQLNPSKGQDMDAYQKYMGLRFTPEARKINRFPSISSVRYFPTGIGYMFCVFLNLPIYFCLQISEICSVLFYAILGYFALKGLPVMKGALFTVMLLPMTLQQCSSISYDVIVLVGSFWVFSYLIKCITVREQIGWKDVLVLAVWSVPIVLTKMPYILIFILFFAIPKEKVVLPVKGIGNIYSYICKYWYIVVVALLLVINFILLPITIYDDVIRSVLLEFQHTLDVFDETIVVFKEFWIYSTVGNFGWLVRPMPEKFIKLSYGLMIVVALCSAGYLRRDGIAVRMWSSLSVALGLIIISLGFVPWTFMVNDIDTGTSFEEYRHAYSSISNITGIQGRYFIPLIPLMMYLAHGVIRVKNKNHVCAMIIIYSIWIIWPVTSIISMFW